MKSEAEYDLLRRRTLSGCISKIYDGQRSNLKVRGHGLVPYNKYQLIDWVLKQQIAWDIFDKWRESDYEFDLTPSIDRIRDEEGYSFSNIQIVHWKDNRAKEWFSKLKPIELINKKTKEKIKFNSIKEACETLDLSIGGISNVLAERAKSTGGFYVKLLDK